MSEPMSTLEDLFIHELEDLLSAELQLVKALPKMAKAAQDKELREAFMNHLEETKEQAAQVKEILKKVSGKTNSHPCKAMEGLIKECQELLEEERVAPEVLDAGLIACANRVEHYEIAAYGCAIAYARTLGHDDVMKRLEEIQQQEVTADETLTELAERRLNELAHQADGGDMDDDEEMEDSDSRSSRNGSIKGSKASQGKSSSKGKMNGNMGSDKMSKGMGKKKPMSKTR